MEFKRLARRVIYTSRWVNLFVDKVQFPDGHIIEEHHLLDFDQQAVAAIVENERGEILFVRVCRYTTGRCEWELPAGRMEDGEDPLQGARRETLEESGFETHSHRLIYSYYPLDGIANVVFHVVACQPGRELGKLDPNETSGVCWLSRAEIKAMIQAQELHDGLTLTGLLYYFQSD